MAEFEIEEDIRRARTLPSRFYTEEAVFERSKDKIFSKCWHLLGRLEEFKTLDPQTLLPGFLDEPILVTRSDDGIRCLSNVCTHRGKILVEKAAEGTGIRCGYHGRRFSLEGKFLSMPEFEEVDSFPTSDDDLFVYRSAEWLGFTFVACDPVGGLTQFTGPAEAFSDVDERALVLTDTKCYTVDAHWALYCENYLEGFHVPFVHKSLNEAIEYSSYKTKLFRYSSLQTAYDRTGAVAGRYLFVFPNLMFNFYDWGVSVNIVEPKTPFTSVIRYLTYVSDTSSVGVGAGADLHAVELEDEAIVESVQRGIRSRHYDRGRYSPTREQGTHHFHRLIAEFIG